MTEALYKIIGEKVKVSIDRPLGSFHPRCRSIKYVVNYGYVEGLMGGDGAWQDAYVLGVDVPIKEFYGVVVAVVHRFNDVEDKLIVAPEGYLIDKAEISSKIEFQEQYFQTEILM